MTPRGHGEGISWLTAIVLTVATTGLWLAILSLSGPIEPAGQDPKTAMTPLRLALAQAIAFTGVIVFAIRPLDDFAEKLRITPVTAGSVAAGLLAGVALQFPLAELGNWVHEVMPPNAEDQIRLRELLVADDWKDGAAIVFAFLLVAPVTEELLFRGVILNGLNDRYGPGVALVLSSLLFGIAHLDPTASIYATGAGLVLGFVALKTGSTTVSIVVHAGVNAAAVFRPESLVEIPGFNTFSDEVEHVPWSIMLGASAVTLVSILAILRRPR